MIKIRSYLIKFSLPYAAVTPKASALLVFVKISAKKRQSPEISTFLHSSNVTCEADHGHVFCVPLTY